MGGFADDNIVRVRVDSGFREVPLEELELPRLNRIQFCQIDSADLQREVPGCLARAKESPEN